MFSSKSSLNKSTFASNGSLLGPAKSSSRIAKAMEPPDLETLSKVINSNTEPSSALAFKKQNYKFIKDLGVGTYAVVKEAKYYPSKYVFNEII